MASGHWRARSTLLLALVACKSTSSQLEARFSREQGCPVDGVRGEPNGGNVYRVTGCGKTKEYVCSTFAHLGKEVTCAERGLTPKAEPDAPPMLPPPSDQPLPPGSPR